MKTAITALLLVFLLSCSQDEPEPRVDKEESAISGQWDMISATYADAVVSLGPNRAVNLVLNDDSSYYRVSYMVVNGELTISEKRGVYSIENGKILFSGAQAFAYRIDTGLVKPKYEYLTLSKEDTVEVFEKIYR